VPGTGRGPSGRVDLERARVSAKEPLAGVEALAPAFACRSAFRGGQEVLQRDVEHRGPRLGERLVAVGDCRTHSDPPAACLLDARSHEQLGIDRDRAAVADEDASRHRRERVPGGEEPARLVERGRDDAAVRDAGTALVALVEGEERLVLRETCFGRLRQPQTDRVVAAAPARRVVVRRDLVYGQTPSKVPKRSSCR